MTLSNMIRSAQARPRIERIVMGLREFIDADTERGYDHWVRNVVQDAYMADFYIDQLNNRGSVRVNEGTDELEVWNVVSDDRWTDMLAVRGVFS